MRTTRKLVGEMPSSSVSVAVAAAAAAVAMLAMIRRLREERQLPMVTLPDTMKAVVARAGRCETQEAWPTPEARAGEVVIRVRATAVNRLDTLQRKGKMPVPPDVTEVLGLEVAGEVAACGKDVATFAEGDAVLALVSGGGYAEYVTVHASTVMHKPPALPWAVAASIPEAWLTAFKLVHVVGRVQAGEAVLIHAGASGVGVAAIQLVKAAGAVPIVTVGSLAKLDLCVRLGAVGGAVRHDGPWGDKVRALAPSSQVQLVLDCVAGAYAQQNLDVLDIDGRWVLYSALSGPALAGELGTTFLAQLMKKRVALLASTLRTRPTRFKADLVARFVSEVLPRLGVPGGFEHVVDREFDSLADAQAAHDYMETNANEGKIVVHVTR